MPSELDIELGALPLDHPDAQSQHFLPQANDSAIRKSSDAEFDPDRPPLPYRRRHRDAFARQLSDDANHSSAQLLLNASEVIEAYIDPSDGRLRNLRVQCDPRYQALPSDSARWEQNLLNPSRFAALYLPTALSAAICLFFLAKLEPDSERHNFYEPVLYKNWRHPEMIRDQRHGGLPPRYRDDACALPEIRGKSTEPGFIDRRPMPRHLCFIDHIDVSSVKPRDQVARPIPSTSTKKYVFISYTRAQFHTGADDIDDVKAHEERLELLRIGIRAAKKAGVKAFWLDCFPPGDIHADKEDVYRICDIVRSAHSLVLAVDTSKFNGSMNEALQDWGKRLWTLPELLLSPARYPIGVYNRIDDTALSYDKRYIGHLSWGEDWQDANQLVDHYDSSVHLTQLELISIANRCLRRRVTGKLREKGDYAYALMGLLRRRPQVVKSDTDFMAFARLSLSNSSSSIIERLLCMQSPSRDTPWHSMVDAYGAQIYDIEPTCQIADVDDERDSETIVIDGVYGASICWSKLERVSFLKRPTLLRRLTKVLLPKAPFLLAVSIFFFAGWVPLVRAQPHDPLTVILFVAIIVVLLGSLSIVSAGPALLKSLYYGKFWSTGARFFGVQGLADLSTVERSLFGLSLGEANAGRLKWSTSGSLQSRAKDISHSPYFEGTLPESLPRRDEEGKYLFTLIDTYVLEATVFYSERPPSAVLICGRERGMQRAVLCSYDWMSQTFCREVVLRMKTIVLNRMSRVDQCRVAFRRRDDAKA